MTDIEKYNVKSQMVKASENEAFFKQLNITGNLTLMMRTVPRISWDFGSARQKANITGCRFLMKSKQEVWRMCCSSVWMAYPDWRKAPGLFLKTL